MNGPSPDLQVRRGGPAFEAECEQNVRGLLHDLGHQMMTLSLLAESVRDDGALSAAARERMEIVKQEMFRIVELIADSTSPDPAAARTELVNIRDIAKEAAQLARLAYDTSVTVEPGVPAVISINPVTLRRVLRNLIDNAVRAAGPGGLVWIRIEHEPETAIEITDTGPGFGRGPSGAAGLGLTVARKLLDTAGGKLDIGTGPGGGARVRVTFGGDREDGDRSAVHAHGTPYARHYVSPSLQPGARATAR